MKAALSLFLTCAFISVAMAAPARAQGTEKASIIVVGEDADDDSVSRFSSTFQRVEDSLIRELNAAGFSALDETAASLGNFDQDHLRRADLDLIAIARSATRATIDVAVVLTIFADVEELRYTTRILPRVKGRLLDVKRGRQVGSFEIRDRGARNAPANCPRECILEAVGRRSNILVKEVKDALSIKLADFVAGDD